MEVKNKDRVLFLKYFTKELILQSQLPELKQEISEETLEQIESEEKPEQITIRKKPKTQEQEPYEIMVPLEPPTQQKIKPQMFRRQIYRVPIARPITRPAFRFQLQTRPIQQPQQIQPRLQIRPQPSPEKLNLEKLNPLVQDNRVTVIECPGPNKLILVRTIGQITTTRISLNQEEIQNIINVFSKQAKIPLVSGLFKAAVGNLIITAVISELVGSRFIITKMTPRYMLEQQSQRFPVR